MTTRSHRAARRVTYQRETLWDHDHEPTHQEPFAGTSFFARLTEAEQKDVEIRVSAWRSPFLHGEQGVRVVCGQLVNSIPELDARL